MKKSNYSLIILMLISLNSFAFVQTVSVANFSFTPSNFTINIGDTIRWVLVSGTHTTTSLSIPAGATSWNAPINVAAPSFTYKPNVAGTFTYQCNVHTFMQGSFTVTGCPPVSGQIAASSPTVFCGGGSTTINFNGTAGAAKQWKLNGTNITLNGTGSSYIATKSGSYTVLVSNNCGSSFTTNAVTVTVNPLPKAIILQGDTVLKCAADSILLDATTTGNVSYHWLKSNAVILGANSPTYKTKAPGNYKVTVIRIATGCGKTSKTTKVINNCRDAEKMNASIFLSLSPNPVTDQLTISFEAPENTANVQIVNAIGQILFQKQITSDGTLFEETFSISDLPTGVYSFLVQTKTSSLNKSFVKN